MLYIKVPASTSNLGPGFDSIGMAVNIYLELEVEESNEWDIQHLGDVLSELSNDENHYIRKMCEHFMTHFNLESKAFKIIMYSDIPLARGLGSSGSALIASLEIINHFYQLNLSEEERIRILSEIEGHPDNVAPSIKGGIVAGYYNNATNETVTLSVPVIKWPIMVVIPNYELKTEAARNVLPDNMAFDEAVKAGSIANMLVAALYAKDYSILGEMMMNDLYHEQYRAHLVPHFQRVKDAITENCYAFLSGAGPSIFIVCHPDYYDENRFNLLKLPDCEVKSIEPDQEGVITFEKDGHMLN
ncbi:homoserine kinase [Macrococcus armenti]|uniref:homoserine kinase n=1 Tax=Macrococcus armenti TaxID=2875764 RepID=UPI001CCBDCEF|nr:homoserine kinase [Macrococcus armenti]UBH23349.1 homoserine kinase [Macrococcus armenti]